MMTLTLCLMMATMIYIAVGLIYLMVRNYRSQRKPGKPKPRISKTFVPENWDGTHFNNFSENLFKQIKAL
jgi:hypothetical protein